MSGASSVNGTTIVSGPDVIQVSDFYVHAGILHPIVIGSIALIATFLYLRLGSNRSIAPITVFDWLVNVALGSTLAGIVNGNSLVRGLLALLTLVSFQFITSTIAARFNERLAWIFQGPPLVVMFRGKMLTSVMAKHRISSGDVWAALRQQGVLCIEQVECGIIEPNGTFSVFTRKTLEEAGDFYPGALMAVPAYKALCEELDGKAMVHGSHESSDGISQAEQGIEGHKAEENQQKIAKDHA